MGLIMAKSRSASGLDAGGESFELAAVFFVTGVVVGDFSPEGVGVVEMIEVGEFVEDDIVAERLGDVHETDVEGDGAITGAATPAGGGVTKATLVVFIAVKLSVIFKAIRKVIFCLFHEDFFLGVAGALGFGATKRDFFADEGAVDAQKTLSEKVASVARDGHLEPAGRRNRKPHTFGKWVFAHNNFAELGVIDNHQSSGLELGQNLL